MTKPRILIVEDDRDLRDALVTTLELAKFRVHEAADGHEALRQLSQVPVDMVISDVHMPGLSGHELLTQVQRLYPGLPMLLMTAYGQVSRAVSAMQAGAIDYLIKPFEGHTLVDAASKITDGKRPANGDQPVAEDPVSKRMFQLAVKVANSDSTVMISGESGTGKEVLARYIHQHSPRATKPFIAINCAAIPENMLEAILFGHEKGAFTGAIASSPGKFEQANGGTILLDEVSEMDPGLQSKLLRVLQEREVERVGGRKTIALDVRVIATTNRDLAEHVRESRFREDLYYRLTVFPMHWQPLRERPLDILPLANAVLKNHSRKLKLNGVRFAADACEAMLVHPWPGNVRELDNAIQRALVLHQSNVIHVDDLCLDVGVSARSAASAGPIAAMVSVAVKGDGESTIADARAADQVSQPVALDAVGTTGAMANQQVSLGTLEGDLRQQEFRLIIQTLRQERGRRNRAAEQLGISPRTLRYKLAQIREAGIDLNAEMALT